MRLISDELKLQARQHLISLGLALLLGLMAMATDRVPLSKPVSPARSAAGGEKAPAGLTAGDWAGIRGEYERHRHAAVAVAGGHQARNYAQQWLARFDGRGFTITPNEGNWGWGLELKSYGFAGRERPVNGKAEVRAEVERVTYAWN